MTKSSHTALAFLLLRVALGLNILLHGAVRLGPNYAGFIQWTEGLFKESPLPSFLITAFAAAIPVLELIIGVFLTLGLFTLPALVAGTLLMIALMTGMCLLQKWDIVGLQMTYIFLYTALIAFIPHNLISADHRRKK